MARQHPFARALAVLMTGIVLVGCSVRIPSDPDGTLDRVTGGTLRAGASPDGTLVVVAGDTVSGPLADLVEGFAQTRDAEIVWTVASEESLVADLEAGDLDLAIGGVTDASPWSDRVSLTRGYSGIDGAGDRAISVLLPQGENGLQTALEQYLDAEVGP